MPQFENPIALLLCIIPLGIIIQKIIPSSKKKGIISLPLDVWKGNSFSSSIFIYKLLRFFYLLFISFSWICLVLALAKPLSNSSVKNNDNSNKAVIFAIDVSPSMAAKDMKESRLEVAKTIIHFFINSSNGASGALTGIVAFGEEAALLCPPTNDYVSLSDKLNSLDAGILGDGTAIGQGLSSALKQIKKTKANNSFVVLMTDGEDNAGLVSTSDAAMAYKENNTQLIITGFGTKGEVPIEYTDPTSGKKLTGTYKSSYSDSSLSSIADTAKGIFIKIVDSDSAIDFAQKLSSIINESSYQNNSNTNSELEKAPYYDWLILLAMIFSALSWIIRHFGLGGYA